MFPPSRWINCHSDAGEQWHCCLNHVLQNTEVARCFSAHKHIEIMSSPLLRAQGFAPCNQVLQVINSVCFDREDALAMFCPIETIKQWRLALKEHWSSQLSFHLFLHKTATNTLISWSCMIPSAARQGACRWTSMLWRTGSKIKKAVFIRKFIFLRTVYFRGTRLH